MMIARGQKLRNERGRGAGLLVGRRERVRSVKMAKMAAQVFGIAMVESQENTCSTLLTSVSYSNLPTTFVGGVSSGISRFNQDGDLERALLRNGNVHSADDWRSVLEPVVARYRATTVRKFFRGDAAFAIPDLYTFLEAERYLYAIRLKSNGLLEREIQHLLKRPVGRPPEKPIVWYHDFMYQAASWDKAHRVVAKVEWHQGELFPRVGFVVTNLGGGAAGVVWFYNGRGTAEQWIKEGKNAVKWTRLSCHDFVDNQVRLQLFALAYNLGNFLRRLALPVGVKHWSMTTLREKLIKIGAKVVLHARSVVFQMAEVAVPRKLFRLILARIRRLRSPMAASG